MPGARRLLPAAEISIGRSRLELGRTRRSAHGSAAVVTSLPLLRVRRPLRDAMPLKDGPGERPSTAPLPGIDAELVAVLAEPRHQLRQHAAFVTIVVQHFRR